MFERKQTDCTYKKKKFTVQALNVSQAINLRSRFQAMDPRKDPRKAFELMVDFLDASIVKPKMVKDELLELSEEDLNGLFEVVAIIQGFLNAPDPKKRKSKKS